MVKLKNQLNYFYIIFNMKKSILIILIAIILGSCGGGTDSCIVKLQKTYNVVYPIDAFNYIVKDSIKTYHFIPNYRWCTDGGEDKLIEIK